MANGLTADIHKATTWSIVLSVLMIVAGVLAIFVPAVAGIAVTTIVGWLLVFSGVLHLGFAWRAGRAGGVLWEVLLAAAYGIVGLYLADQSSRRPRVAHACPCHLSVRRERAGSRVVLSAAARSRKRMASRRRRHHAGAGGDDLGILAVERVVGAGNDCGSKQ